MDAHNLAIMFGPTLVRSPKDQTLIMIKDMHFQTTIVETIIKHVCITLLYCVPIQYCAKKSFRVLSALHGCFSLWEVHFSKRSYLSTCFLVIYLLSIIFKIIFYNFIYIVYIVWNCHLLNCSNILLLRIHSSNIVIFKNSRSSCFKKSPFVTL